MGYSINVLAPSHPAELAVALRDAAAAGRTIALAGSSSKRLMAGPVEPADVALTTSFGRMDLVKFLVISDEVKAAA